jgi:hypothetical protein
MNSATGTSTSTSTSTSRMNFDPLAAPADNNNGDMVYTYPTAQIVLIDEHDNRQGASNQFPAAQASVAPEPYSSYNYHAQTQSSNNNYASAQIVDPEFHPYNESDYYASETHATATPLDPWSKAPIASTEQMESSNTHEESQESSPTQPVQVVQPASAVIPLVALEEPFHKKYRRRRRRRGRMALSGVAGFVVGSFAGPFGAIVGAASGVAIARVASKAGERKKDRKVRHQMNQFEQQNQERLQLNRSQQLGRM